MNFSQHVSWQDGSRLSYQQSGDGRGKDCHACERVASVVTSVRQCGRGWKNEKPHGCNAGRTTAAERRRGRVMSTGMIPRLAEHFSDLVHRHIPWFTSCNGRGIALCIFHQEKTPSLSIDLEKGVFHCFGCGRGGGVRDFARLVGEPWGSARSESRTAKAQRARFQAEQQARVILERRAEERDKVLCAEHRELYGEVIAAADLLSLFHRRPDLASEFPTLVARTECEYGDLLFQCTVLKARLDGEVE